MPAKQLSEKEQRFVEAYTGEAAGNASEAARAAGYSERSAGELGYRLLKKVEIVEAIEARQRQRENAAIATAAERDEILTLAARAAEADWHVRIKAIAELNKVGGRHLTRLSGPDGKPLQAPIVNLIMHGQPTNGHG
jgi:phage terminase small subunit